MMGIPVEQLILEMQAFDEAIKQKEQEKENNKQEKEEK